MPASHVVTITPIPPAISTFSPTSVSGCSAVTIPARKQAAPSHTVTPTAPATPDRQHHIPHAKTLTTRVLPRVVPGPLHRIRIVQGRGPLLGGEDAEKLRERSAIRVLRLGQLLGHGHQLEALRSDSRVGHPGLVSQCLRFERFDDVVFDGVGSPTRATAAHAVVGRCPQSPATSIIIHSARG